MLRAQATALVTHFESALGVDPLAGGGGLAGAVAGVDGVGGLRGGCGYGRKKFNVSMTHKLPHPYPHQDLYSLDAVKFELFRR